MILVAAVPVATVPSHGPLIRFHWLDGLQPPPLPSRDCHRGTSPRVLLNTAAVFQRSQQQFKMRKWVSSQTQKRAKHQAFKIPPVGKGQRHKRIHVLLRCSKKKSQRRGKKFTCKGKDKTSVEQEEKISPTHKQINSSCIIHGLCSWGLVHLSEKGKNHSASS